MSRIVLAVLVLLFTAGAAAQTRTDPALGVSLRSDKQTYSIRDEIGLELRRENTGTSRIALCREWAWGAGRTRIRVLDSSGKEVITEFLADGVPPPPQGNDVVVLEKNDFIGTHLKEPVIHFVNKPGEYQFILEYTSYLSERYARKVFRLSNLPFWSRERGVTTSEPVKIRVTE